MSYNQLQGATVAMLAHVWTPVMLYNLLWRDVNRHLFNPDKAPMTEKRNYSLQVLLVKPITLLSYL